MQYESEDLEFRAVRAEPVQRLEIRGLPRRKSAEQMTFARRLLAQTDECSCRTHAIVGTGIAPAQRRSPDGNARTRTGQHHCAKGCLALDEERPVHRFLVGGS